ncbi:MAG: hypothetical protein MHMPM18_001055 [Marteilia pararefringens]
MFAKKFAEMVKNNKIKDNELKLEMYALFKQATEGDMPQNHKAKGFFTGQYKLDAWKKKKGLSKEEAELKYCEMYDEVIIKSLK